MTTSLLAHIVKGYASRQWENIATDSLHYLLRRPGTQDALMRLLGEAGLSRTDLRWRTQASNEDRSRPDLVGYDQVGRPRVMIEVKFWARLTDNQPNAYVRNQEKIFPDHPEQHLLMFLVPERRQQVLSLELRRRLLEGVDGDRGAEMTLDEYLASRRVHVVTWSRLLRDIRISLTAADDAEGLGDLAQLQGMCDRAEAAAMLPISAEELDPVHARRYRDYARLATEAIQLLQKSDAVSTEGIKERTGEWGVGSYIRSANGVPFWFGFYHSYWAEHYATPWWLQLSRDAMPEVHSALRDLVRDPRVSYVGEDDGMTVVAVPAPIGLEAEEAAQNLADFVHFIFSSLDRSTQPPRPRTART